MEKKLVLILVFVEFTLRELILLIMLIIIKSLNPCFCGIYSQRGEWSIELHAGHES